MSNATPTPLDTPELTPVRPAHRIDEAALAAYLADERSDEVSYARFLGGLIMVGAPAVMIIAQPDLGSEPEVEFVVMRKPVNADQLIGTIEALALRKGRPCEPASVERRRPADESGTLSLGC